MSARRKSEPIMSSLRTNLRGKLNRSGLAVDPRKITTVYVSLFSAPVIWPTMVAPSVKRSLHSYGKENT
jgi:hypothetical protein